MATRHCVAAPGRTPVARCVQLKQDAGIPQLSNYLPKVLLNLVTPKRTSLTSRPSGSRWPFDSSKVSTVQGCVLYGWEPPEVGETRVRTRSFRLGRPHPSNSGGLVSRGVGQKLVRAQRACQGMVTYATSWLTGP